MTREKLKAQYPELVDWLPVCPPEVIEQYYADYPQAAKFDLMLVDTPDWRDFNLHLVLWLTFFMIAMAVSEAWLIMPH